MYYATKFTDGLVQVRPYQNVSQIQEAYDNYTITKIILPFEAEDLKDAAIKAGNKLEGGQFILMELQKNGLEIPRRYDKGDKRNGNKKAKDKKKDT